MENSSLKMKSIEKFLNLEADLDLFDLQIDQVSIWKYIREFIYDKYLEKSFNVESRVAKISKKNNFFWLWLDTLRYFIKRDTESISSDILFCNFPRKIRVNGDYICQYICDYYEATNFSKMLIEYPLWIEDNSYKKAHFDSKCNEKIYYTDYEEITACLYVKVSHILFFCS